MPSNGVSVTRNEGCSITCRTRPRPGQDALRTAWASEDHELALDGLGCSPASSSVPTGCRRVPPRRHRGDAHAHRLGVAATLSARCSHQSDRELIEIVRRTSRNVKRWQSGDMCCGGPPRHARSRAAVPQIIGYSDLASSPSRRARLAASAPRSHRVEEALRSHRLITRRGEVRGGKLCVWGVGAIGR